MPRDNFTKPTIDALAKRVSFHCSNPDCEKITVGPNSQQDGVLLIGVAAHITAASQNGPRFDPKMSTVNRASIGNGIWLCANCSVMIDKDEAGYPVSLLHSWKQTAEKKAKDRMAGVIQQTTRPYLEADLIWAQGGRANHGLSDKNPLTIHNGVRVYEAGPKPIIHWLMDWNYKFVIYNNSSVPAFNMSIRSIGTREFDEFAPVPKINNLPALSNMDLQARLEEELEGDYTQADAILKKRIPDFADEIILELSYQNEQRKPFKTLISFKNGEIQNLFS
jgi:hypothetical protein